MFNNTGFTFSYNSLAGTSALNWNNIAGGQDDRYVLHPRDSVFLSGTLSADGTHYTSAKLVNPWYSYPASSGGANSSMSAPAYENTDWSLFPSYNPSTNPWDLSPQYQNEFGGILSDAIGKYMRCVYEVEGYFTLSDDIFTGINSISQYAEWTDVSNLTPGLSVLNSSALRSFKFYEAKWNNSGAAFPNDDVSPSYALQFNDLINGGSGADVFFGLGGSDLLDGGDGDDFLYGDGYDDVKQMINSGTIPQSWNWNLSGKSFNDLLGSRYRDGIDYLSGGNGNDGLVGGMGNDILDGESGIDTAIFNINSSSVTKFIRSFDGLSYIIQSSEGTDTLTDIEKLKFNNREYSVEEALFSFSSSPISFATPKSIVQSIGLTPDGLNFLIKVNGVTSTLLRGESLQFSDGVQTTEQLASQVSYTPLFQSSGQSVGYTLPELFTGPASLNLQYQLIETADNAVVIGGTSNDFIKVASTNSTGKAVDGGAGSDVIDGGVGSTFITGGAGGDTFFLDGRAPGVSWSTITDFNTGSDKATIWGFVKGVSSVDASFTDPNNEGAPNYQGLTLHFKNLLPSGQTTGTNADLNSITLSGRTLADIGVSSLQDLNNQINKVTTANEYGQYVINDHLIIGQTQDAQGTHGYLFVY